MVEEERRKILLIDRPVNTTERDRWYNLLEEALHQQGLETDSATPAGLTIKLREGNYQGVIIDAGAESPVEIPIDLIRQTRKIAPDLPIVCFDNQYIYSYLNENEKNV